MGNYSTEMEEKWNWILGITAVKFDYCDPSPPQEGQSLNVHLFPMSLVCSHVEGAS